MNETEYRDKYRDLIRKWNVAKKAVSDTGWPFDVSKVSSDNLVELLKRRDTLVEEMAKVRAEYQSNKG